MTKKFLLHLLLFLTLHSFNAYLFAQVTETSLQRTEVNSVSIKFINNQSAVKKDVNGNVYVDYPEGIDENSPGKPILPSRSFIVAIPPMSKVFATLKNKNETEYKNGKIDISPDVVFNPDSSIELKEREIDLKYLTTDTYPEREVEVINYTWLQNFYCAVIQVNPYLFSWKDKSLKVIESGELEITFTDLKPFSKNTKPLNEYETDLHSTILNYEQALDFRSNRKIIDNSIFSTDWIDYTKTHYKLGVIRDGIYRINYNDLLSYGISPSSINPKTIKIFVKGEQLPLLVSGEDDLVFDESDYIEFWCTKNYSGDDYRSIVNTGQDYLNYMNRYNDTTSAWLVWDGENGLRLSESSGSPVSVTDTVTSHLVKTHLEDEQRIWYYDAELPRTQLPFWQEHKVWTWLTVSNNQTQQINFQATDFLPSTPVRSYVRLISNAGNIVTQTHKHGTSINSTTAQDTITFDYRATVNFNSTFSSSQLNQGNNVFRVFGLATAALFHRSLVDWIDIEYYRQNRAVNDSLLINIPDSVTQGVRNIKVTNVLSVDTAIVVYKVIPLVKKITGFQLIGNELVFSDTVSGGDRYFVMKTSSLPKPVFKYQKQFVNLPDPSRGADYIIITNKLLSSSVQQYNQFINQNYSERTSVIYVDDIYDEFAFGDNNAEAIKEFLITANQNWVAPAPTYLVLAGDANYDYKEKWNPAPSPRKKNLVPSYGFPVRDNWFTCWDTTNINIPQMYVGRISANDNDEVINFLNKHQNYLSRRFDDYNKRFTFYSGGDPSNISELAQIKAANDSLLNNIVRPSPVGGKGIHFYKTVSPPTNFGPYTVEEIRNAVDSSGLFISYIGHSGTRTWDNGITEVEDIKNIFSDRHPLMSDFGCSTGKFAEPDVDAFGELFVFQSENGQAIGYLGNSSLGYVSTSLRYPGLFYKLLMVDTLTNISKAHFQGKINQMNLYGFNEVNRVFNHCNLLFTDPIIKFATPVKSNFVLLNNSVNLNTTQLNDLNDSVLVSLDIKNWGRVNNDSLQLLVENRFADSLIYSTSFKIPSPVLETTIQFYVITNALLGQHSLTIKLDPDNLLEEIYEDDNEVNTEFTIYSTSLRALESELYYTSERDTVLLLNPTYETEAGVNDLIFSVADNESFNNAMEFNVDLASVFTKIPLNSLSNNQRYWYRARINSGQIAWSSNYSFNNIDNNYDWFVNQSHRSSDIKLKNVKFDSLLNNWKITETTNQLKITSAGSNDGKFASILFNSEERLPNTFFWGMVSAEIDSITLEPTNIRYFAAPNTITQNADSLIAYINSLPDGKMLALAISDDAAQTVLGFSGNTPVRHAIETLGSLYIDSVRYRESWSLLGVKGAPMGSVPESYKKLFQGPAIIDTSKFVINEEGYIVFPVISKSTEWESVFKNDSLVTGSNIDYIPLGIQKNKTVDTLSTLVFEGDSASISFVNAEVYPEMKILAKLSANELKESPAIQSLGVNYSSVPELAINYQVVSTNKDSVLQGESINISYDILNVGDSDADSFYVKLNLIKPDFSVSVLSDSLITQLSPFHKLSFSGIYLSNSADGYGNMSFRISIDDVNDISELFEDNNLFEKSFYVIRDTVTSISESALSVTFDGREITDGEYVSSKPEIKINLNYPIWFPLEDTTSLYIILDTEEINYSRLDTDYDTINRIAEYSFSPAIVTGENRLRIFAKDVRGVLSTSPLYEKYFTVSDQLKIENAYNFPNPFSESTYFTFVLPTVPDELRIIVYTVAGRKIREINFTAQQLRVGYNALFWDGKDQDGDIISNGVYFAKVILTSGDDNYHITQKLSVIR